MKIVAIAGSPKGETSVTMQYVEFLRQQLSGHEFPVFQAASTIRRLEKNEEAFEELIDGVRAADAVLWAFPLYFCLCCSQYRRFIELIRERNAQDAFAGKYAAVLTTSIHYFDHIAHAYMRAVSEDLGMTFAGSFSAEMRDLLRPEGRDQLRRFAPLRPVALRYAPGPVEHRADQGERRVVILHDAEPEQANLEGMVRRLRDSFAREVEVVSLHDVDIRGGCLGCMRCGQDNVCAYTGKDGYIDFYNQRLRPADIIVFAAAMVDRHISSRWRMYFDRSFFNTHAPSLTDKQFAFLVSGPLSQGPHLREFFESYARMQQSNPVDVISDEVEGSTTLDAQITSLAVRLTTCARSGYAAPHTFPAVGGCKIFRDDIFGPLRFVFQADHRYYRKHGFYDFPQRALGRRLLNPLISLLFRVPGIRRRFDAMVKTKMVEPYRKALKESAPPASTLA